MTAMTSCYQAFCHQLNAQAPQLVTSIKDSLLAFPQLVTSTMDSLLASPDSSECSCERSCRIGLIRFKNKDGTTCRKLGFRDCKCTPLWHNFHQRQLDFINANLNDARLHSAQLTAFKNGVQQLRLRHRELTKQDFRNEQYWLCQDYARTDKMRWIHNLDVRKRKQRRRFGMIAVLDAASTAENDGTGPDPENEIPVEAEDLYIDEETYEFPLYVSDKPSSELQCISKATSHTQNEAEEDSHPVITITLDDIRRNQHLTIDEILERFEDLKQRATARINTLEDEDTTLANKIDALYVHPWPETQSKCGCTAELKLYHKYQNFGNSQVYAELEAEMSRSDLRLEQQSQATAARGLEIKQMLRSIDGHVGDQVADVEVAHSREGVRQALVRYLRRYDPHIDLRVQPEDGGHSSEALTLDLLRKIDEMLERWAVEDASRCATIGRSLVGY
ncbi:MAG: hypothetical protein LQ337_005088 [Flavoplaca oasis]|nr:MAG: hypothetical protein LQ337_005088 [Flavoplaca oasis]